MPFKKATKEQSKLRLALIGISGSGKTMTALKVAKVLGSKTALIDTERGSASKYADQFDFDVLELDSFHPQTYIKAIGEASGNYDTLIIDSLSHAWSGKDGALELVDRAAKRSQSGNTFMAWREVTPLHNALVDAMLQANCHVIVTMRAKTEYVQEKDEKTGKLTPRKVGLQPVQRDGLEYEFDVVGDMTNENDLIISKTRCPALTGQIYNKPGDDVAGILKGWVSDGVMPSHPNPPATPRPAPQDKEKPSEEQDKASYYQAVLGQLGIKNTSSMMVQLVQKHYPGQPWVDLSDEEQDNLIGMADAELKKRLDEQAAAE